LIHATCINTGMFVEFKDGNEEAIAGFPMRLYSIMTFLFWVKYLGLLARH
jgi:hypothetical protein